MVLPSSLPRARKWLCVLFALYVFPVLPQHGCSKGLISKTRWTVSHGLARKITPEDSLGGDRHWMDLLVSLFSKGRSTPSPHLRKADVWGWPLIVERTITSLCDDFRWNSTEMLKKLPPHPQPFDLNSYILEMLVVIRKVNIILSWREGRSLFCSRLVCCRG